MNIYNLINRANLLQEETTIDSISPSRIGSLIKEILLYINEYQLLASSPEIQKIYLTVSAMQSDGKPVSDLTGRSLNPGQLVVIVPESQTDATAGDVYRYDGPSGNTSAWTFVAKIGAVPADSELNASSTNPVQNKVVTEKLTELSAEITSQLFEPGNVGPEGESANSIVSRTNYIPCKQGDVISGYVYIVKLYDKDLKWLGEEQPNNNNGFSNASHTITNEACAYVRLTARNTELYKEAFAVNGVAIQYLINKDANKSIEANKLNANKALETSSHNANLLRSFFFTPDSDRVTSTSFFIPVTKGDVVSATMYRIKKYNEFKEYSGEDMANI